MFCCVSDRLVVSYRRVCLAYSAHIESSLSCPSLLSTATRASHTSASPSHSSPHPSSSTPSLHCSPHPSSSFQPSSPAPPLPAKTGTRSPKNQKSKLNTKTDRTYKAGTEEFSKNSENAETEKTAKFEKFEKSDLLSAVKLIEERLYIRKREDWYQVPKTHVITIAKLPNALQRHETIEMLVKAAYPDFPWDYSQFVQRQPGKSQFSAQLLLFRMLRSLLPDAKVEINARSGHDIMGDDGRPLEIDIYFPDLQLGFEYQDAHHYFTTSYGKYSLSEYQSKDRVKQAQGKEKGITLINVPFWWDWSMERLVATIYKFRPDLVKNNPSPSAEPFEEDPPRSVVEKYEFEIPGLGIPMLAMHAPKALAFDPTKWWIFEKYDGVRAIWDGPNRQLYSRWGRNLSVPNYVHDSITSDTWLDGEIWFGRERGARYEALKTSRVSLHLIAWEKLRWMIFDLPRPPNPGMPYFSRYKILQDLIPSGHPFISLARYDLCTGKDLVESIYFKIRAKGGEGVILRYPDSPYTNGYSRFIYKHKGFQDAEALVIERKSKTRFLCKVRKPDTIGEQPTFDDESDDKFYVIEMPVDQSVLDEGVLDEIIPGKFVSFRHSGEHAGHGPPLNPKIYSLRSDVTEWEQLLVSKRVPPAHQRIWEPREHGSWRDAASHKAFFDALAKERNFDPLVPENWYSIGSKDILPRKGSYTILAHYEDSYIAALMSVYPDIGLKIQKFNYKPRNYWASQENRRKFFDEFAAANGFDPLAAEKWYEVSFQDIAKTKGGEGVLHHHESLTDAIMSAYPHIGLNAEKFKPYQAKYWNFVSNRRKAFDSLAASLKFDPLKPENWYSLDPTKIKVNKQILKHYSDSYIDALLDLYPSIGLEREKFVPHKIVESARVRRRKIAAPEEDHVWPQAWAPIDAL